MGDVAPPTPPAFAADFPEDPQLAQLLRSFTCGDYAAVRAQAPQLAAQARSAGQEDVALAAEELRRRLDPEPAVRTLLWLSALLLVVVALWSYTNQACP